jgi:hypothetical protein
MLITAHHWSLSKSIWVEAIPSFPVCLIFVLIISSYLCLEIPNGLFQCYFSKNKIVSGKHKVTQNSIGGGGVFSGAVQNLMNY